MISASSKAWCAMECWAWKPYCSGENIFKYSFSTWNLERVHLSENLARELKTLAGRRFGGRVRMRFGMEMLMIAAVFQESGKCWRRKEH